MGQPTAIRCVLFDLDGTLADTAPDLVSAMNRLLRERGQPSLPFEQLRPHASHGSIGLIKEGFGLAPEDAGFEALRSRFLTLYEQNLVVATQLFPGMEAVLAQLEQMNIPWGIVTNKPAWLTDPIMEILGLDRRAACVVSGDTTPQRKPHPQPLHHACQLLDLPPEACIYVGDAERDIIAGKCAGMTTLVALFGYIHNLETPHQWGATALVSTPQELVNWLQHRV